jgi:hypothetical protein
MGMNMYLKALTNGNDLIISSVNVLVVVLTGSAALYL